MLRFLKKIFCRKSKQDMVYEALDETLVDNIIDRIRCQLYLRAGRLIYTVPLKSLLNEKLDESLYGRFVIRLSRQLKRM